MAVSPVLAAARRSAQVANIVSNWDTMYRLLDPAGYVFQLAPSLNLSVPVGRTWYLLNAWFANINGRFTEQMLMPFVRTFPAIEVQGANAPGDISSTTLGGNGMVLYQPLPSDW
jgi:hypothetical protein